MLRHLSRPFFSRLPAPLYSLGLAALVACGSSSGSGDGADTTGNSPVKGQGQTTPTATTTVISLPIKLTPLPGAWDDQGSSLDASKMSVRVGDPAPVFTGSTKTVAWTNTTTVSADACTSDAQGVRTCSLTIADIETKDYSIGMLVEVSDSRQSYTGTRWTGLSTGVAQTTLTGLRGVAAGAAPASPVFVMTTDGATQLGTWSGVEKVDLIENGAMIGLILDKNAQPVKGAQLSIPGSDPGVKLVYANADFTAPGSPGASATLPYFVITPTTAEVVKSSGWTITAPSPATATWSVPLVGSAPNYLVMIPFLGN